MVPSELQLNLQNGLTPKCVTQTLQNGVSQKQLYFIQLSVEEEEKWGQGNLLNGKGWDLFKKEKKKTELKMAPSQLFRRNCKRWR